MYVNLHVAGKELLYRSALADLAEKLDPRRFVRVHRSTIVNFKSILQSEPVSPGEFDVLLRHGAQPHQPLLPRTTGDKGRTNPVMTD